MTPIDQALNTVSFDVSSALVPSPCIYICDLDDDNICVGCYRSIDEIVAWGSLDNSERAVIIELVNMRKKTLNKL